MSSSHNPSASSSSSSAKEAGSDTTPTHDPSSTSASASASTIKNPPLCLPCPSPGTTAKLDVSGDGTSIKLDHLGPMVVNVDGTISRIGNWGNMAPIEKKNALRILADRNKRRLDALKEGGKP
ncbi:hypothetical protein E4U21_004833 [Claviceps maximensis]|nr:hypothetical protein E4U21_004833 [Claviceps maximensis]